MENAWFPRISGWKKQWTKGILRKVFPIKSQKKFGVIIIQFYVPSRFFSFHEDNTTYSISPSPFILILPPTTTSSSTHTLLIQVFTTHPQQHRQHHLRKKCLRSLTPYSLPPLRPPASRSMVACPALRGHPRHQLGGQGRSSGVLLQNTGVATVTCNYPTPGNTTHLPRSVCVCVYVCSIGLLVTEWREWFDIAVTLGLFQCLETLRTYNFDSNL